MSRSQIKPLLAGILASGLLTAAVVFGSRNLAHFDAALVPYTFATIFTVFAIAWRYTMWLSRPPTRRYWVSAWQTLSAPRKLRNLTLFVGRFVDNFILQRFIWHRSRRRWCSHILISWGTTLAASVTFPLVFGWIHFESVPGDLSSYRTYVFGFAISDFPLGGFRSAVLFHVLAVSSVMVLTGCGLAFHRRLTDPGALATEDGETLLPLLLLFLIAFTGILLTISSHFLRGYLFDFLAVTHAVLVIGTLLYVPFGKLFHIFQRPAQIGVLFYQDAARAAGMSACDRCKVEFAPRRQIEDLQAVQAELGFDYRTKGGGHYQTVCPACRRKLLALSHAGLAAVAARSGPNPPPAEAA